LSPFAQNSAAGARKEKAVRVLVTGFEPFAGAAVNPSQLVVERLRATPPAGADFAFSILPVVYYEAARRLREELDRWRPDLYIGLGQGAGAGLRVEQVGINLNHVGPDRGDNAGNCPQDEIAIPQSPDTRFATIPVRALVAHLCSSGIPAVVSYSAGTFVCNHVMFAALDYAANKSLPRSCGFIHTPLLPEQAAALAGELRPSMALEYLEHAVRTALIWLLGMELSTKGELANEQGQSK
jgi:pyroglutamyl-peptidase